MRAIVIEEHGGPEVLQLRDLDDPRPGPGEIVVDVAAAGVNFIDTYHRTGLYQQPLPMTLGREASGTVSGVGVDVDGVAIGDRVAFCAVPGAYAERVIAGADRVVPVPDGVSDETAAAVMLQGLTAEYLSSSTYPLTETARCLIHAGAGGVGLLLTQMAKMRGAEVITTVGSDEKAELSRAAGADHVINYADHDFADVIEKTYGPGSLDVVYDGVGAATFDRGLRLLRLRGMMVAFGNASGPPEPISPLTLGAGSWFLTRPSLFHYIATRSELLQRSAAVFAAIEAGLDVRIGLELPLAQAADAHRALEGRETTGKVLLRP